MSILNEEMTSKIIKKLSFIAISFLIIYMTTEWIVYGLQTILFNPSQYITYVNPLISFTKLFAMGLFFSFLGFKYFELTRAGKIFFTFMLIISLCGLVYSSFSFQAANETKIVKFRVHSSLEYSWDEVDFISTHVYRENRKRSRGGTRSKTRKLIKKYNIHVDENIINVYSDFDKTYELHQLTSNKNIKFKHKTESEYFDQRFKSHFKDNIDKSYSLFGIN